MTTGSALAKAAEDRTKGPSPLQVVKQRLDFYGPVLTSLLPAHVTPARFAATIANAIRVTPGLGDCHPDSIVFGALRAAQYGLEPNDGRNLCHLVPYNKQATFQMGYGGVLELLRRAVPGVLCDGRAVYPNDEFDVDFGRDQPLVHRPASARGLDRGGDAYAWYLRLRYPDGRQDVFTIDKPGVEYHRSFSKQPNGKMWKDSYDAAALKSVVLENRRWLPQSAEMARAFSDEDRAFTAAAELDEEPLAVEAATMTDEDVAGLAPEPISGR